MVDVPLLARPTTAIIRIYTFTNALVPSPTLLWFNLQNPGPSGDRPWNSRFWSRETHRLYNQPRGAPGRADLITARKRRRHRFVNYPPGFSVTTRPAFRHGSPLPRRGPNWPAKIARRTSSLYSIISRYLIWSLLSIAEHNYGGQRVSTIFRKLVRKYFRDAIYFTRPQSAFRLPGYDSKLQTTADVSQKSKIIDR